MVKLSLTRLSASVALAFSLGLSAQAAEQTFVTGTVQGPGGEIVSGATVYICTGLVKTQLEQSGGKDKYVLYYSSAKPGDGKCVNGRTNSKGEFKIRYPNDRPGSALFVWKKLYEPVIVRDVVSPMDMGTVKLPATSEVTSMDKKNWESKLKAEQTKADNEGKARASRIERWERNNQLYPNGIYVVKGLKITDEDIARAKKEVAAGNATGEFYKTDKGLITFKLVAEQENAQRRVTARLLDPQGKPVMHGEERIMIHVGQDIRIEKASPDRWKVYNVVSSGELYEDGNLDFVAPPNKKWDLFVWRKGYEPLLIKGIQTPASLGDIRIPGSNAELKQFIFMR